MWFPPELLRLILHFRSRFLWLDRLSRIHKLLHLLVPVEEETIEGEILIQYIYKTHSSWFLVTSRDGEVINKKRYYCIKDGSRRTYRAIYWPA